MSLWSCTRIFQTSPNCELNRTFDHLWRHRTRSVLTRFRFCKMIRNRIHRTCTACNITGTFCTRFGSKLIERGTYIYALKLTLWYDTTHMQHSHITSVCPKTTCINNISSSILLLKHYEIIWLFNYFKLNIHSGVHDWIWRANLILFAYMIIFDQQQHTQLVSIYSSTSPVLHTCIHARNN